MVQKDERRLTFSFEVDDYKSTYDIISKSVKLIIIIKKTLHWNNKKDILIERPHSMDPPSWENISLFES